MTLLRNLHNQSFWNELLNNYLNAEIEKCVATLVSLDNQVSTASDFDSVTLDSFKAEIQTSFN